MHAEAAGSVRMLARSPPLLALSLTTSPVQISLLSAATWLPWLLLGVAAGVVVDRVDRRWVQVVALVARAGLLAAGAALGLFGALTMPLLVAVVLAHGATEVFADLGATSSILNLASTAYFAVFVLWAVGPTSAMGLTESQFPLVMLGFALGAVAGSLVAQRVQNRLGEVVTIVSMLTGSVVLMLVPVFWPNGWAVAAAVIVIGVTNTIGHVVSQSLRQRLEPRALLGRVSGASRTLSYGLMPLGALLGGLVGEWAGLRVTFVGAVVMSLAACGYLAGALRNGTKLTSVEPETPKPADLE